jgi:hypothetical protein
MTKVYACLIGDWVCLNDDPECKIGNHRTSPYLWWEEGGEIYAPLKRSEGDTMYQFPYVDIIFKGHHYRVSPYLIQIVQE